MNESNTHSVTVVDRSVWRRGEGIDNSMLLNDHKFCFFGFYAKDHGIAEIDIKEIVEPIDLLYEGVQPEKIKNLLIAVDLPDEEYEENNPHYIQKEIVYDITKLNDVPVGDSVELSTSCPLPGTFYMQSEEQREEAIQLFAALLDEEVIYIN